MTMTARIILVAVLVLSIAIPFGAYLLSEKKKGNFKAAVIANAFFFFGTLVISHILLFTGKVSAAETDAAASAALGWRYLAAALSTGLSCVGGGIAVASAASAAIGAMSEDSSIMGRALIFVALAEGIALYGLIVTFSILP